MRFLGNVLATVVGIFIFCMLFFFLFLIIGLLSGDGKDTVTVKENSVLELDLATISNDYAGKYQDPWIMMFNEDKSVGFIDILNAIEEAKKDENIKGISLLNTSSMLGLAQSKALRDQLLDFKKSKKFIVSYSDYFTQKEYYINSIADTLYLNPVGVLDFKGLATEVMFFKDFQDQSGIKMEVIRHGKYKSAVEPFLANEMSAENRLQLSEMLNSAWASIVDDISKSRNISVSQLNAIAENLNARTPEMAKTSKLIDKIGYEDEYHKGIKKALKVEKDEDYNSVSMVDYAKKIAFTPQKVSDNKIAIIYAQGEILGGEGDVNIIGEGSIRRSLKEAREDKEVKAIVLRVDSPGGSALTSELIWREIEITKKTKPVVVSMGNYAASGGYYIACNANKIIAEPTTITGSIGVFGTLPNLSQISKKYGINTSVVKTHENADGYSVFQPLSETQRNLATESVERIYSTFINRVAKGRKMSPQAVDAIAQGRVWTGSEALKIGLVDKLGGLEIALQEAAKLAKIKEFKTENFPEYEKDFSDLFANFPLAQTKEKVIKEEIGVENYELLQRVKKVTEKKGIQVAMPFVIIWK